MAAVTVTQLEFVYVPSYDPEVEDDAYELRENGVFTRIYIQDASSYGGGYIVCEISDDEETWFGDRGTFSSLAKAKEKALDHIRRRKEKEQEE
jgi:hypothetical protein